MIIFKVTAQNAGDSRQQIPVYMSDAASIWMAVAAAGWMKKDASDRLMKMHFR
jgi:hypothetical protein